MSVNEEAVIIFPIKFETKTEGEPGGDTGGETQDTETVEKLTEFIQNTDRKGLQTLSSFARNPTDAVQGQLLSVLGRAGIHGALALAVIAAITASPEILRTIVKQLSVKGGPLNQDFHRFLEEEFQRGIDREAQYRRATGLDVIITTEDRGFILSDPAFVNNSLVDIDKTRIARLTIDDTQFGYTHGL